MRSSTSFPCAGSTVVTVQSSEPRLLRTGHTTTSTPFIENVDAPGVLRQRTSHCCLMGEHAACTRAPLRGPRWGNRHEGRPSVKVPAARMVFSDDDRASVLSMVDEVLRTGSLTLGPHTRELEEAFRTRHEAPYAVAVSSGTSALEIILRTLGVEGQEVVVPANTF